MAAAPQPTNERIIEMLERIHRQLRDLENNQAHLSADLSKLAESVGR